MRVFGVGHMIAVRVEVVARRVPFIESPLMASAIAAADRTEPSKKVYLNHGLALHFDINIIDQVRTKGKGALWLG
jgi:hypothetical protein